MQCTKHLCPVITILTLLTGISLSKENAKKLYFRYLLIQHNRTHTVRMKLRYYYCKLCDNIYTSKQSSGKP